MSAASGATCTECEDTLAKDEAARPSLNEHGDVVCDTCWRQPCQRCGEYADRQEFDSAPGRIIAVWREAPGLSAKVSRGYYRILGWPFYADGMVEAYFFNDRLRRVRVRDPKLAVVARDAVAMSSPICRACEVAVMALRPPARSQVARP